LIFPDKEIGSIEFEGALLSLQTNGRWLDRVQLGFRQDEQHIANPALIFSDANVPATSSQVGTRKDQGLLWGLPLNGRVGNGNAQHVGLTTLTNSCGVNPGQGWPREVCLFQDSCGYWSEGRMLKEQWLDVLVDAEREMESLDFREGRVAAQ
jgi:hypothetical protein